MNLYIRRKLISVPLLITGFVMILGSFKADAALLKDIRIGEYEGFTRIVFELDTPGNAPHIQPQSDGTLTVSFDGTQPKLKRKIPVKRSEHVERMKFWHRQGRLSTIFQFDFKHFRFETFPLENPPRIVLDIHPLADKPMFPAEPMTMVDAPSEAQPVSPSVQTPAGKTETKAVSQAQKSQEMETRSPKVPVGQPPATSVAKSEAEIRQPSMTTSTVESPAKLPTHTKVGSDIAREPPKSNLLQFYLVIALVVITIVILALLLLMLLARHRWTGEKDVPNVNEYLKNQDQHIASINARIQEQLKRYEEA